jgi:hypothetical protein
MNRAKLHRDSALRVQDIAEDGTLRFVSDLGETCMIKDTLGESAYEFDSFFVEIGEGGYTRVFGMYGCVPFHYKSLITLRA